MGKVKANDISIIIASLLPIFFTEGFGSDVMRRIALPMVGGMVTTTLLTLIVIPVVYYLYEGRTINAQATTFIHNTKGDNDDAKT